MAPNQHNKYENTYLALPYDETTGWEADFQSIKCRTVGGVEIRLFPYRLEEIGFRLFKNIALFYPLTQPLRVALETVGTLYTLHHTTRNMRGPQQLQDDMVHAFIRHEQIWAKVEALLGAYAEKEIGREAIAAEGLANLGECKFMPEFERFYDSFGKYTENGIVHFPFGDEITDFNSTTQRLIDDVCGGMGVKRI